MTQECWRKGSQVKITIPREEDLATRLEGVHQLLTAKRWERAAIVAAYVVADNSHGKVALPPGKYSVKEFAEKGFAGLTSRDSVGRTLRIWQETIGVQVNPGDEIELPLVPYPMWPKFGDRLDDPRQIAAAIRRNPQVAAVARAALRDTTHGAGRRREPADEKLLVQDIAMASFRLQRGMARLRRVDLSADTRQELAEHVGDIVTYALDLAREVGATDASVTELHTVS
jgi:hypothetical protein